MGARWVRLCAPGVCATLVLLMGLIGCASSARQPADAASRIHGASPDYVPLFASIVFTPSATYAQATAILGGEPYPSSCDGVPRTPEPAPQTTFATRHYLLISYPTWDLLLHIASSP